MDTLNIGGNERDRFYRYKMPKLISKIEGKGNGIKTVVPNMTDIARSLSRPPTYPTKFFGCELGAQVKCDEKTDRYIVNGSHDAPKLQELLNDFIKKFVLCAGCNNPETDLIITGKSANTQKIILDCKACGQRTEVDMRHKLVTFILKHPPTPLKGKSKKDKKSKKNGEEEADSPTSPTRDDSAEGSDDEFTKRIVAEAAEIPTVDKDDDDNNWAVDTSAEAVAERMKDLSLDVYEDESDSEPHELLDEWLKENSTAKNNDIYKKIKELGISKETDLVMKYLVLHLFPENAENIEKQIGKRKLLFQKFIANADDQLALLGATEELLAQRKELMDSKTLCGILMNYYQNDLLEEEVFQAWIEGSNSPKYRSLFKRNASVEYVDKAIDQDIRNKAKPFAKWLEEAEEDDDE